MQTDLPPPVGELTPVEIEIVDATLPALALGDNTPLLDALEAILHARANQQEWERYQGLSSDEKLDVLNQVRDQIPLIPHD